jgi:P-type conjugative transfer protein TrbG
MRRALAASLLLLGCTHTLPPAVTLPPPAPVFEEPVREVRAPILEDLPSPPLPASPRAVEAALREARVYPSREGFRRGLQRYQHEPHAIYRLDTAVERVSLIELAPGEKLNYAGLADTTRWVLEESVAGMGEDQRTILLLKPKKPKLSTNVVIATSFDTYMIEAHSHEKTYLPAISWRHPDRQTAPIHERRSPTANRYQVQLLTTAEPSWMVRLAWDDGRHTFIQCDEALKVTEAPVVYLVQGEATQLINYRLIAGVTYKIDRLLQAGEAFELRVGAEAQAQAVRVAREGAP